MAAAAAAPDDVRRFSPCCSGSLGTLLAAVLAASAAFWVWFLTRKPRDTQARCLAFASGMLPAGIASVFLAFFVVCYGPGRWVAKCGTSLRINSAWSFKYVAISRGWVADRCQSAICRWPLRATPPAVCPAAHLRCALGITPSANKTRNSLLLDPLLFDTPSLCTVQHVLGDSFFLF